MDKDDSATPSCPFAFGPRALGFYLAYLGAFVPLSTTMYLPALPTITAEFQSSAEVTSLSLSLFTLCYGVSMLFWGPCSDRRGRVPILRAGLAVYIVISAALSFCSSPWQLILGRCVQAVASGSASAMSLAIIKDSFRGRTMETMMGSVQAMTSLAPVLAPVLGGLLLQWLHWRGIFWLLTACGVLGLLLLSALRETAPLARRDDAASPLARIRRVLGQKNFSSLLALFSLNSIPFLIFVATSSYVYEGIFGLTPQRFSLFYAANAVWAVIGPVVYLRCLRDLPPWNFFLGAFLVMTLCGGLLLGLGSRGPVVFALIYVFITLCGTALRAASTILLMGRVSRDTGTAASLIGSTSLLFGALGMMACSLPWPNFITAAGCLTLGVGTLSCTGWLALGRAATAR